MKIILPIIIIILLAGGWYFYSQKNKSSIPEAPEVVEEIVEESEELAGEVEDSVHSLNNGQENVNNTNLIGEEGAVTQLEVNPLLGIRAIGNPNAPIKITEFFSLTCNHCATFHTGPYQELKAKYIDTGKVYFVYEEFPLNGPALYGSMIARCLPEERYTGFIDILFRTQETWAFSGNFKESLRQNAKLAGMSDEEFDTCFDNKELQNALAKNIAAATDAYNVSSTPTFVINDGERVIRGAKSMKAFDALVEYYDQQATSENDMPVMIEQIQE